MWQIRSRILQKNSALTQTGSTLIPQRTKTGAPRIEKRERGHGMASKIQKDEGFRYTRLELDIFFSSNHNIHKSLSGLCFWASDSLIEIFQ